MSHSAAIPNSPTAVPCTAQPACKRSTAPKLPFRVLLRGLRRGAANSLPSQAATSSGDPPRARPGPHGSLTVPSRLPQRAGSRGEAETLRAVPPGSLRASAPTARPCPGRPHPLSASAAPQRRLSSAGPNRAPASQPRTLPPGPAPTPSGASRSLPSQPPGPHLGAACGRSGARGRGLCALGSAAPRQNGGRGRALTSRPFPSPVPSRHARGREGGVEGW